MWHVTERNRFPGVFTPPSFSPDKLVTYPNKSTYIVTGDKHENVDKAYGITLLYLALSAEYLH